MKLWYCVINGGDGSASVAFFDKEEHAEAREKFETENYDGGWGESSVNHVEVESLGPNFKNDHISMDEDYNEVYP